MCCAIYSFRGLYTLTLLHLVQSLDHSKVRNKQSWHYLIRVTEQSNNRVGIAKQVIDVKGGRYRNELYVGGSGADGDEDAWLTAVLDASWNEWDGAFLDSGADDAAVSDGVDYGATTWKVDFETLQISAFGIPLFTQKFKAGTARTWKMTYLDDETRIVRAGKTGRPGDDVIFYMKRGSS